MAYSLFNDRARVVRAVLAAIGIGLGNAAVRAATTDPTGAWEYATPEEQGVDSAQLARMYAQVQRDQVRIDSFVLVRHGKAIAEAYVYPYTATTKHTLYSVSKSFTSALLGIAIEQGLFTGVDEKVEDIFNDVTTQPLAANMHAMRLRHLLTMSTGHATDTTGRITATTDWVKAFMELPVENVPGSGFVYNSGATFMVSAAIQRRSGVNALTYASRYLFPALGITDYSWDAGPGNISCGGWGLSLRPLDMAKFGQLYLHNGRWNGQQIVPEAWVAESSRKQISNGTEGFWGSGYGYYFWLNDFGGYRADGALAQYIFVLPAYDAVAVFTCNLSSDTELPARLMRNYVLPAMTDAPLAANPRANAILARVAAVVGAPGGTTPPCFASLPSDATVSAGATATFTVAALGSPTPSCEWLKDDRPLGRSGTTLTLTGASAADAGEYTAVLRNSAGALASFPVKLTVLAPPVVFADPVSLEVATGEEARFQVAAGGGDLQYEWKHDGVAIPGAGGATLTLQQVSGDADGDYRVIVRNPRGSVTSAAAHLSVAVAREQARLVNLSARALAGTGERTLIAGLVIAGGDRALPVMLRGVGPTLTQFRLTGVLADPTLLLHRSGTPIATNNDWQGAVEIAETADRVGAFPLPDVSADAVLVQPLAPGLYTVHMNSGVVDQNGLAMVECYDAAGRATAGTGRLVNLSARAQVGTGDNILIAGFAIAGTGTQRVLIRGIGPTLATQGVQGVLTDPVLQLHAGDRVIATNDDWAGDAELQAAFRATGAFDLPANSADAALLTTLPAGVYTVHVGGKGGITGVGMVEVYAVP